MTKFELVDAIAVKTGLTKKDVTKVLDAFVQVVPETVANGENVALVGFGTFSKVEREARTCINPQTKEHMQVAAKTVPHFKAGKTFKDAVL